MVALLLTAPLLYGAWKLESWLKLRYYRQGLHLVTVVSGLGAPWSLAFLPDGSLLVTEREGRLHRIAAGHDQLIRGLPPVWAEAEGGLFTVLPDPDFVDNHLIYFDYAEPASNGVQGAGLAVARGRLDGVTLTGVSVIFRDPEKSPKPVSFGARMMFGVDHKLYVTVGDRGEAPEAQRLSSLRGKIIRLNPDGSVPADNPFVGVPGANPAVWALGFRDPQGIAQDPVTGRIWSSDHGPAGGDEINLIRRGHNYGWPVVSHGVDEGTGAPIGEGASKPGLDEPAIWWGTTAARSVPPTGMTFLDSERYPAWKRQLFVGTLMGQSMMRLKIDGTRIVAQSRMYTGWYERIRDVRQGPDGWLYMVSNRPDGSVVRLER